MSTFGKVMAIIFGVLMICTGIACMVTPTTTYSMLGYIIGVGMIFDGIGSIFAFSGMRGGKNGWLLAGGILSLIFGMWIVSSDALQQDLNVFFAYYIAVWMLVRGILILVYAGRVLRFHKNLGTTKLGTHWWIATILGALMVVLGILSLIKPVVTVVSVGILMGLSVLLTGIELVNMAIYLPNLDEIAKQ